MRLRLLGVAAALLIASGGGAHAQTLGDRFEGVLRSHVDAQAVEVEGARALQLRSVDYAGFRWKTVDFVFDASGRLARLTMSTDAGYDTVLSYAKTRAADADGLVAAATQGGPELQMRVCEGRDGTVSVTYEAASVLT